MKKIIFGLSIIIIMLAIHISLPKKEAIPIEQGRMIVVSRDSDGFGMAVVRDTQTGDEYLVIASHFRVAVCPMTKENQNERK